MRRYIVIGFWLAGSYFLSQGLYMEAKAEVAQILIASSWNERTEDRPPTKPWWWADTRPIAKLDVPRLNKTLYVMQDDSGESLAFGPGHLPQSARPAQDGHVMIAGHRDSHFSFLREISIGDTIKTSGYGNQYKQYRVSNISIIDSNKEQLNLVHKDQLTLITCYPFDDFIPGGPLRMIVHAVPVKETDNLTISL